LFASNTVALWTKTRPPTPLFRDMGVSYLAQAFKRRGKDVIGQIVATIAHGARMRV